MTSRLIGSAYVFILVVAGVLGFSAIRDYDTQTIIGARTSLILSGAIEPGSGAIVPALEQLSRDKNLTIARSDLDLDATRPARTVYVSTSPLGRSWLATGYPSFSEEMRTTVLPLSAARDLDPRGTYLLIGSEDGAHEVLDILSGTGGVVAVYNEQSPTRLLEFYFGRGPLLWIFLMSGACSGVVMVAGLILDSKRYAVQILSGWSRTKVFVGDLMSVARWLGAFMIGGLVITFVLLSSYNGGRHFMAFVVAWLAISVLGWTILAFAQYVTLRALAARSMLVAIRGGLDSRSLLIELRIAQVVTVVVALLVAAQLGVASAQSAQVAGSNADWKRFGSLTRVNIGAATSADTGMFDAVGSYGVKELRAGRAIIALPDDPQASLGQVPASFSGWNVLFVNSAYLDVAGISDPMVTLSPEKGRVHVLAPEALHATPAEIESVILPLVPRLTDSQPHQVTVDRIRTSDVVTFGKVPPIGEIGQSAARHPRTIVTVLPDDYTAISNREVASMMSNGSLLFIDQAAVMQDVRASRELSRYVLDVETLGSIVVQQESALARSVTQLSFALILAMIALIGISMANTVIYVKANSQRIWVQVTSGWPAWLAHLRLWLLDVGVAAGLVAWQVWRQAGYTSTLTNPSSNSFDYFHASMGVNAWAVPGAVLIALAILCASAGCLKLVVGSFIRGRAAVT